MKEGLPFLKAYSAVFVQDVMDVKVILFPVNIRWSLSDDVEMWCHVMFKTAKILLQIAAYDERMENMPEKGSAHAKRKEKTSSTWTPGRDASNSLSRLRSLENLLTIKNSWHIVNCGLLGNLQDPSHGLES